MNPPTKPQYAKRIDALLALLSQLEDYIWDDPSARARALLRAISLIKREQP